MSAESQDYIFTDVAFMALRRARAHAIARLGLLIFFVQGAAWTVMEFFDGLMILAVIDLVATSFSAVLLLLLRRGWTTLVKHAAFWLFFANAWLIVFVGDGIGPGAQLITLWWFAVLALGSYLLFFDSHRAVLLGYHAACVGSFALVLLLPVQVAPLAPPPPDFFDVVRPVSHLLQLLTMLAIVHTFTRDIAQAEVQLSTANNRLEGLLENILPVAISKRLREDGRSFAEGYADVSVMFADIVGFTELASARPPREIVDLLDRVFSRFDDITEALGLEKIKTIGDAYMVASGVPGVREDHAGVLAQLALRLREAITEFPPLTLRIGINSGAVVAGVIGKKRFIYDVWGDAVNVASRMESHGIAGQIQITEATYELVRDRFEVEERGFIEVKGKGQMKVYLLKGPAPLSS